jgi:archaeal type IV pilus assembly protein PilA
MRRKAISPVIATVILVAIGMIIAMAASFFLVGTAGQYTSYERVEIASAYSTLSPGVTNAQWGIVLDVKNSGSRPSSISMVTVNEVPIDEYGILLGGVLSEASAIGSNMPPDGLNLQSGESTTVYVWVGSDLFSSGTSISVKLQSVSGIGYIKLVQLT